VFGTGDCAQLGLGEDILSRKKPANLAALNDEQIVDIAAGGMHNMALTAEGKVTVTSNHSRLELCVCYLQRDFLLTTTLWLSFGLGVSTISAHWADPETSTRLCLWKAWTL
jgi:hypothetical protein